MSETAVTFSRGDQTRNAIKREARRLFAAGGIDGVSVRDIATAANQRNSGSVQYYFGSKEALITELVVDGARLIDQQRNRMLDLYAHGPPSLRKVLEILVVSSVPLGGDTGEEKTYLRFILTLQASHRQVFVDALANRWNSGYQRCLSETRSLLPGMDEAILNQRLVFMSLYLGGVLAAREAVLDESIRLAGAGEGETEEGEGGGEGESNTPRLAPKGAAPMQSRRRHRFWEAPYMLDNLVDTLHAMLASEPSAQTLAKRI